MKVGIPKGAAPPAQTSARRPQAAEPERPAPHGPSGAVEAATAGDGDAVARAAAFGHSFARLAPAAPAPIQAIFKDPDDPDKNLSEADVRSKLAASGLPDAAQQEILKKHGHRTRYTSLDSEITKYASVYGSTQPTVLDTYGEQVPIRSSKLRHARRIQKELGKGKDFSRNIAYQKLVHKDDPDDKIYLGGLSLGLGFPQLELDDDPSGEQRKRSHSESVLKAAHQSGGIVDQHGGEVDLSKYEPVYAASTNEFCQDVPGQQNCHGDLAPSLTADKSRPAYIANKYSGSDDSHQFKKTLTLHESRKRRDRSSYESEAESEDDATTPFYLVDDKALRGKRVRTGGGKLAAKKVFRGQKYG